MNYFGHAALAVLTDETPEFVLGAMAPDLLPMVGARGAVTFDDAGIARGADFHLKTDALFHETDTFMALNREALAALRQLGVSRGPARAAAHMGVEMLIDAALIKEDRFKRGYLQALAAGATSPSLFTPLDDLETQRVAGLCSHLAERAESVFAITTERFELRVGRALASRPRLAPTPAELSVIANYLCLFSKVEALVPRLMEELTPLGKRSPGPTLAVHSWNSCR